MGAGRLGIALVGLHLHRMDQVRELDRVLDEEDGDVVANQIPVALGRIELDRKAAHVARRIDRARAAGDGREAGEQFGLLAHLGQDLGRGEFRQTVGQFEEAVGGRAAGMDDPLRDTLVVEMLNLLAKHEVFQQGRAAPAGLERVLIVADRRAVIGGQAGLRRRGGLVHLAGVADCRRAGRLCVLGHLGSPLEQRRKREPRAFPKQLGRGAIVLCEFAHSRAQSSLEKFAPYAARPSQEARRRL